MRVATLLQPFRPPFEAARRYNSYKFRKDIVAGLTVSVVEVPQAMAYAIIAGVPPVYGIYTSIIQGIIGSLLSSSEHMTTGPTNTQSLLIASAVHRIVSADQNPARYLEVVVALTLLKGLVQLTFAAAQMGNMVRYVSHSVITGLVSGAGLLIFFGQLPAFLGVTTRVEDAWPGVIGAIQRLVRYHAEVNPRAIAIGAAALAVIVVVQLVSRFLPAFLIGIAVAAVSVGVLGWTAGQVQLIENLPPSLPSFAVPHLTPHLARELFGGALALAVIGMLESVAIAKSIASHTGEEISANQEFFAQGLKNCLSSFWHCIPGSGSFSRSALDHAAGAETRFAAVYNACFVAVIFFLFGRWAHYIPRAALAAVLFAIAYRLVDWRHFLRLTRTGHADAAVCLVTFLATLLVPLEYAIFAGIFLNIAIYLKQASRLHIHEMVPSATGPFLERPIRDRAGQERVLFLQVEGDLFFAVADELQDRLTAVSRSGVRVVILRLKRTHSIDATCLHVLEQFIRQMRERDGHVILCGVRDDLLDVLRGYGVVQLLGPDNLFTAGPGVFESAKQALARAQTLTQASIDTRPVEEEMEADLSYEI